MYQLGEKVSSLPAGTLWRHNQAGDLPGHGETIDRGALETLVAANAGRKGFTYTHKHGSAENIDAIRAANTAGFTVNLSADSLPQADQLYELGLPVTVVLPASVHGNQYIATAAGNRVVVCPATYRDDVNCKSCGLCQVATRKVIVGFPAHGPKKALVA